MCTKGVILGSALILSHFVFFYNDFLVTNFPIYCAPVAQFVEHRALMREAVSSTPAGPTLRVLK